MKKVDLNYKRRLIFVIEFGHKTGGMLHSVFLLISEIKDRYEIIVICPKGDFERSLLEIDVKVSTLRSKGWRANNIINVFLLIYQLRIRLNSFRTEDCIIVTNNIFAQFLVSVSHYKKKFNYIYFNRGGHFRNKIGTIVAALSNKNDVVICTSRFQKEIIDFSGILRYGARSEVLYNPIEYIGSVNDSENLRSNKFKIDNNSPFLIGVVGYVAPGKNQILAVQALKEMHNMGLFAYLNIYGECNDFEYFETVKLEINKLELNQYVVFHGYVSNKNEIYNAIDLLLSTSLSEGFGRTLAEAMLYRKPVVALTCAGGPVDIVKTDEYGLLVDDKPIDIACAVHKFATDDIYRVNTVNTAYTFAKKEFSPKNIALTFEKILQRNI